MRSIFAILSISGIVLLAACGGGGGGGGGGQPSVDANGSQPPPKTSNPDNQFIQADSTAVFESWPSGSGLPETTWYRNGVVIPNERSSKLYFKASSSNNNDNFYASVKTQYGTGRSTSAILKIDTIRPLLPGTGILESQCYKKGSNNLVSCSSDVAIALNKTQDGMLRRGVGYSLVEKFDISECVKDEITGLIWEGKKSDTNVFRGGRNITYNDAVAYASAINELRLCGFSDWRIPDLNELHTIVYYGRQKSLDKYWFPYVYDNTSYWTSSPGKSAYDYWTVGFVGGSGNSMSRSDNLSYVRLVRGVIADQSQRYIVINDGNSVKDNLTGLEWRRCSEGQNWNGSNCTGVILQFTHEQALEYASNIEQWRIPNIKELVSIIPTERNSNVKNLLPAGVIYLFSGSESTYYWSSTPQISEDNEAGAACSASSQIFGCSYGRTKKNSLRLVKR